MALPALTPSTENCRPPETPGLSAALTALTAALRLMGLLYAPLCALKAVAVRTPKLAVTVFGAFMVRFCGLVVPVRSPLKPVKAYPALGVAWMSIDPTGPNCGVIHVLPGLMEPPFVALVVRKYWV